LDVVSFGVPTLNSNFGRSLKLENWALFAKLTDNALICIGIAKGYGGKQREGPEDNVKGASSSCGIKAVPIIQPRNEKAQQLNVQSDHLLVLVHGILARFVRSLPLANSLHKCLS